MVLSEKPRTFADGTVIVNRIMELVYIYAVMSLMALVGIIWLQIKMRKDKRRIL